MRFIYISNRAGQLRLMASALTFSYHFLTLDAKEANPFWLLPSCLTAFPYLSTR